MSRPVPAFAQRAKQAQWKERDEWRPTADVGPVLAVEGSRVSGGILGGRIAFLAARPAAALAVPAHRRAVARETEAMAENAAAEQHRSQRTPATAEARP